MARREVQAFNSISFLNLLSAALKAVIFLFIIVPKGGGASASVNTVQAALRFDTLHRQVWGSIVDSLAKKKVGDTLLVIISDYGILEQMKECPDCPTCPPNRACPTCPPPCPADVKTPAAPIAVAATTPSVSPTILTPKPPSTTPSSSSNSSSSSNNSTTYRGVKPSISCKAAFEISWGSEMDNVDLFVYKGNQFVSGASSKRRNSQIGDWDSGRSKTKLFGNDFRTNQEAVRQFNKIIAGEYKIYAQFKEANPQQPKQSMSIAGLVYTRNEQGKEEGKEFSGTIPLSKGDKKLLATVVLKEDGSISIQ